MKVKTLLVIHTPPPFGGGEIQAQNVKNYFQNNKDFYIYDYSRKTHSREDWNKVRLNVVFHGVIWILNVSFLLIKLHPRKIYLTLPKSFFAFLRNATIFPLARLLNIKILGELPGTSFLFLEKKKSLKYKVGIYFLRQIDEIRFLSKNIADMHTKFNLKSARVIDNGVTVPKNIFIPSTIFIKEELSLVYLGSVERSKGIFNSFEAINRCKETGITTHFNVIGSWVDEQEKSEALNYIKSHSLESYITFHGVKTEQEKWNLFKMNAVLVHPTFWDGVPLSILEAMAIGLPVISTRIGGIPDTIVENRNGILLKENTPEQLFLSIQYLYFNRNVLQTMSENNIMDFQKRFDLPIFLNNMNNWFLENK